MTVPTRKDVDYARAAISALIICVEQLAACLHQGVDRPWRAPALTMERRNQIDREARAERLERDAIAPGESPAPLDLDVMDELVEIGAAAEVLADRVCRSVGRPPAPPATSAFADPRPVLLLIHQLLQAAADSAPDPQVVRHVETKAKDLIDRAHQTLGLVSDGQVLKALCPWCGGRTEAKPTGGAQTLRVRNVEGMDSTLVVCEGGQYQPSEADCGTWLRNRPAWRQEEWDWLADRINRAAPAAS